MWKLATKPTQFNWKTHNDLNCLQVDLERMMQNYAKMEKFNLEQHGIITNFEQTYQELKV
jgi:hypothetical protein